MKIIIAIVVCLFSFAMDASTLNAKVPPSNRESFPPIAVNMTPSYNNTTLSSISIAVPAIVYTYPPYTNLKYRFSITRVSNNTTAPDIIQASHFVNIPSSILAYNAQYTIKASAVINDVVLPFAGNAITVFTPSVPLITLTQTICGGTLATLTSTISANPGLNATAYTFRIRLTGDVTGTNFGYSTSSSQFVGADTFAGFPLLYGTAYNLAVQYTYPDPSTGLPLKSGYGGECTIITPKFPSVSLASPLCGSQVLSLNAAISAAPGPYATLYQFRIRKTANISFATYYYAAASASRFSSLGAFGITLDYNTSYSISVKYSISNNARPVWSGYGPECIITTPPSAPSPRTMDLSFKATAYPNPFAANFMLDVKTASESPINLKVYDMVGRLIEQKNSSVSEVETMTIGDDYPIGVYSIVLSQENIVQPLRVVKR
jgi:hypothetical protein